MGTYGVKKNDYKARERNKSESGGYLKQEIDILRPYIVTGIPAANNPPIAPDQPPDATDTFFSVRVLDFNKTQWKTPRISTPPDDMTRRFDMSCQIKQSDQRARRRSIVDIDCRHDPPPGDYHNLKSGVR